MVDITIIGCGVTGAAIAYSLSRYQLKVVLLERENDVALGASKANSGIIHAGYDAPCGTMMARMNVRGAKMAEELCNALDVPYRRTGSLVAGFTDRDRSALEALIRQGEKNGVQDLTLLDGAQARALEPGLNPMVTSALYAPSAAIISPWEYALAMAETAVENGTQLRLDTCVTALQRQEDRWQVYTNYDVFDSRFVINAAGAEGETIHNMAASPAFSLRLRRGQYELLDKPEGSRVNHVIFQCPGPRGKGVLVTPTVHGNLLAGPDAQDVPYNDTATTAEGLAYVRETARRAVPDIDFRQTIRNFAGVRAVADTGDFVIQEGAPGFFDAAGICSPGLSAAPAIGEYLTTLLAETGLALVPREDFRAERKQIRFRTLSHTDRTSLTKIRSDYGQIICRCETVTEGEIVDALHAAIPPRSLDGIKRRVNAGMGRCQGGFCAPRVMALLCRELGIPPSEVVLEKNGSFILSPAPKRNLDDIGYA